MKIRLLECQKKKKNKAILDNKDRFLEKGICFLFCY
jgi:hypothetical protein